MKQPAGDGIPHVDASLDSVRAAIRLVADGVARRVTVQTPAAAAVMPAARQLARAAGVSAELVKSDAQSNLVVLARIQRGR